MKRFLMWVLCLFILAGCMPAAETEMPVFTGTPLPAVQNYPLVLKQLTPTPTLTLTPTSTMTLEPTLTPTSTVTLEPTLTPTPTMTLEPTPTPTGLPDLTIPYTWIIQYDNPCPWGSPGTVTLKVQNIGNRDAGPFVAVVFQEETPFGGLPAGDEAPLVYAFMSGPVGSLYAEADIYDEVVESDEGNNIMMIAFTPPPPCVGTPTSPP